MMDFIPNRAVVVDPEGFRDSSCCEAALDPRWVQKLEQCGKQQVTREGDSVVHRHPR